MQLSLLKSVYDTHPQEISFAQFLKACGNGAAVRARANVQDTEVYRRLKKDCPAVMFSTAYTGDTRDDAIAAEHFNGFATIDVDHCLDVPGIIEVIASWPETCLCGASLSGTGVYAVLKAPASITGATYANWYTNWLVPEAHRRGVDIDRTSCNVSRLRIIPAERPQYINRETPIPLSDGGQAWTALTRTTPRRRKRSTVSMHDDEPERLSFEEQLIKDGVSLEDGLAAIDAQELPELLKRDMRDWFVENCPHPAPHADTRLFLDFETRSDVDIKTAGGVKYARHCEPLLLAWVLGDTAEPQLWNILEHPVMPADLRAALDCCTTVWAHNAQFDRRVFDEHIDYPNKKALVWRDTMILAYAHGLPGALADLCDFYGIAEDEAKDKEGKKLIKKFCVGVHPIDTASPDWLHFCDYCRQDVVALRALFHRLPHDNDTPRLWADWDLDYIINGRGIPVDLRLAQSALEACDLAAADAAARCVDLTGGIAPTQTAALLSWCHTVGYPLPSLGKADVEAALADAHTPPHVKAVLAARLEATKSSTKKFATMLSAADDDGRVRGTLQFYGASHTGRFAGRLLQTQNCPRPTLHDEEIEDAIQHFYAGDAYATYGGDVSSVASSCIRAAIYNGDRPFTICDYSSIENRVLAWFAGEDWKLKAFEEGQDLYVSTYNKTFGANITKKDKSQRQIGKIMELALGYQGAVGSFLNFAKMYNVDLTQLPAPATRIACEKPYDPASGLDRVTYGKIWQIILGWRQAHPATMNFWNNVAHLRNTDKVKFFYQNDSLLIQLPSGRYLCYAHYDKHHKTCFGQIPGKVGYTNDLNCGSNILLNNIVQGTARDLLCNAIRNCEAKGWKVLFHVHDEIIVDGCPSVEALQEAMCDLPAWAKGLPVSAAGEQSYRYTK